MVELDELIISVSTFRDRISRILRGISRIANEFDQAIDQIKLVEARTKTFDACLCELQRCLERYQTQEDQDPLDEMPKLTTVICLCQTDIDGIVEFLDGIESVAGDQADAQRKTEWLETTSKISTRLTLLDSLRLFLSLLTHTLDFNDRGVIEEAIVEEVRDLISESRRTRKRLIEQVNRRVMRGIIKEDTGPGEPNARLGTDENPHQGNEDSNLLQLLARAFITWWNRGKNLDSRSQVNAKLESKTVQVQEITEEGDFLHIADHIRIQKQVGKFAAKIFGLSVDNDAMPHARNSGIPNIQPLGTLRLRFDTVESEISHGMKCLQRIKCPQNAEEMISVIKGLSKENLGASDQEYIENDTWCLKDDRGFIVPKDSWVEVFRPDSEVLLQLDVDDNRLKDDFLNSPNFSDPLRIKRHGGTGNRGICHRAYKEYFSKHSRSRSLHTREKLQRMRSALKEWGANVK